MQEMEPWVEPENAPPEKKMYAHLEYSQNKGKIDWEVFARDHVLAGHESDIPARVGEWQRAGDARCYWLRIEPHDNTLDFPALCSDVVRQVEKDLGRRLEWLADIHTNKFYTHAHLAIRGVDLDNRAPLRFHHTYVKASRFSAIADRVKRKKSTAAA